SDHVPWMRILVSVWLVFLLHWNHPFAGPHRYYYLTRAIVEHGTIHLDEVSPTKRSDLFEWNEHIYGNNNPGLAFLGVPAWAIGCLVLSVLPEQPQEVRDALAHFLSFASTTALC